MLCFWFCRGRFRVFQKYVYKIWSPNPAGQLFGVCFFNIWTSKSSPRMVCFLHFDSQICFNAVRFSLSQLPKVVRHWCVLNMSTSTCASRHNCVHFLNISAAKSAPDVRFFLISHLLKWLRTHRFSEPTFRPSGATKHWKKDCFATFLPFSAPASPFFWLFFSDLLSTDSFSSLTLPTSAFPSVHTVGSLTPIFSSIIYTVFSTCIYIPYKSCDMVSPRRCRRSRFDHDVGFMCKTAYLWFVQSHVTMKPNRVKCKQAHPCDLHFIFCASPAHWVTEFAILAYSVSSSQHVAQPSLSVLSVPFGRSSWPTSLHPHH